MGGGYDINFTNSNEYWDERYRLKGHSGAEYYGRLAEFKEKVINNFLSENAIESIIEFGSGDGYQLSLTTLDLMLSQIVFDRCKFLYSDDKTKRFSHTTE